MGIKVTEIKVNSISRQDGQPIEISSPVLFTSGTVGVSTITWLGEWNGSSYSVNEGVSYGGGSYVCIQNNSGYTPDSYPQFWQLIANRGQDGQNGSNGSDGPQGPQGPAGQDAQPIYNAYTDGNGNMYFQTGSGTFGPYFLQGPQGPSGSNGSDGQNGYYQVNDTGSGGYPMVNNSGNNPVYIKRITAGNNISIQDNGNDLIISDGGSSGIPDAPYDNNTYGRQNNNWVVVSGGGISGVEIYLDGSYQGNYSTINFYSGSGTSSGNNIYLGN